MPSVPEYNLPKFGSAAKHRDKKIVAAAGSDEVRARQRVADIRAEIRRLTGELETARKHYIILKKTRLAGGVAPKVSLYALRLEDNCWYIGMTYNVERRFKKHQTGKGAAWTKRHKPIEIVEVRVTELATQLDAALLEDDMTIEYALKYGSQYVRGGGYCQTKNVRWPDVVLQNELPVL